MGANDKVAATFHDGAAGERLPMPQTVAEIAEAIGARHAVLVVPDAGVRLPVAVTAVSARRDPIDITPPSAPPGAWREYEVGGLVDIDIKLSGVPRVSAVLADRRQRAREAGADALHEQSPDWRELTPGQRALAVAAGVDAAIETATRVRVTPEAIRAMLREVDFVGMNNGGLEAGIAALLRELGFEVEA